jgi:hypothetical protein
MVPKKPANNGTAVPCGVDGGMDVGQEEPRRESANRIQGRAFASDLIGFVTADLSLLTPSLGVGAV